MRPAHLNRLLHQARERETSDLVSMATLRAMQQAYYHPENLGHFGLALRAYAHFTSPIRRYSDLVVHRALIAAHDIGAIGYFGERPLLDMAGLVSPEVIPLLGDEPALADYVRRSGAGYLVTAPGWPYATLTVDEDALLLYTTDHAWTQQQGSNNMTVYSLIRE